MITIPSSEIQLLKDLSLPEPPNLQPEEDVSWTHQYLVFLAEHGYIAKNQDRSNYGVSIMHKLMNSPWFVWSAHY